MADAMNTATSSRSFGSPSLGGERPSPAEILLHLARRVLGEGIGEGEADLPYRIVYRYCAGCRRSAVKTAAGPARASRPAQHPGPEAKAHRPLRRPLREPGVSPPRRRLRQSRWRRRGARSAATCHALIHAGLLIVECDPSGEGRWKTRSSAITAKVKEELSAARAIPRAVAAGAAPPDGSDLRSSGSRDSRAHHFGSPENRERSDLEGCPLDEREQADAMKCLRALGTGAESARRGIEAA